MLPSKQNQGLGILTMKYGEGKSPFYSHWSQVLFLGPLWDTFSPSNTRSMTSATTRDMYYRQRCNQGGGVTTDVKVDVLDPNFDSQGNTVTS